MNRDTRDTLFGYAYLAPGLIILAIFSLWPVVDSILISFQRYKLNELRGTWIGFKNYAQLFRTDGLLNATRNGFLWMFLTVSLQIVLGISFALILNIEFFGRGIVRSLVVLPFFLPGVSMALTWRWMYYDFNGIINYTLTRLHIIREPILWLSSTRLALLAVAIQAVWVYTPFVVINCLARLAIIDRNLYECARLDGAGRVRMFFAITLPQLRGVLLIVVLLRGIWMFNKFAEIHIITGGGPAGATTTLPILAHDLAFGALRVGEGSAVNTFIFLLLLAIAILYLVLFKPAREVEV
jgi:multiple sugar transport system permease protein